jgi:hypothetical protein
MNFSFPLRHPKLSLFPTMSAHHRFVILVKAIQETPEHPPDASRFLDLIWLLTCEYCAFEIASEYFEMAPHFFLKLCTSLSKTYFQDHFK